MAPKEALVISDKDQMRKWSRAMRCQGKVIGLVPTMGYLHEGHLSLVREAHKHAHVVAVSIYVNPGQFSPTEDLSTYPSDFDGDIQKLMSVPGGVDVVFHPHNLYDYGNHTRDGGVVKGDPDRDGDGVVSCIEKSGLGHETWVRVEMLEKGLCGKSRPIFFRGVATIVTKLFNIVEPDVAVFGKKDYQQWRIIQRMVRDLDFSIKIIGSEISREKDGLAMSSRNVHLSPEEREKALSINRSLFIAKSSAEEGQVNCEKLRNSVIQCITEAGGRIDYAEILDLGFFLWMVTKLSLGAMEDRMEGLERQMTDQGRMMETMMRRLEELITRQQQPPPLDDVVNSRISDPGGGQCRNPTQYKGNYNRRIIVPPFDGSDASGCLIQMDRFFQISKIQV